MSYGPIWYEWEKRDVRPSDLVKFLGENATHTRHGSGEPLKVTELYWCQPALYHGAPGFTRTKFRKLVATIFPVPYRTNDEWHDRVYMEMYGFAEIGPLASAQAYAVDTAQAAPGTNSGNVADYAEYVEGNVYPCTWCGRDAKVVCDGYFDPLCVNTAGEQHAISSALKEFDKRCRATAPVERKDNTKESWNFRPQCYHTRGHAGPHSGFYNEELYILGAWQEPSAAQIAEDRAALKRERESWVANHKSKKNGKEEE